MASDKIVSLTDENFESEVLQSDKPVLVDFWADWCMPCKALSPTIDELATDYAGRVTVGIPMKPNTFRVAPPTIPRIGAALNAGIFSFGRAK